MLGGAGFLNHQQCDYSSAGIFQLWLFKTSSDLNYGVAEVYFSLEVLLGGNVMS